MPAGGYGQQGFGGYSFGAGGPLAVVRAIAVAGQVARVVFDEEPLHRSPAGAADALNPANYIFSVPAGGATAPTPVGVDGIVQGPVYGTTLTTDFVADVHVDRQLIVGVIYRVQVRNVVAAAGGLIGSPDAASFNGVTRILETKKPQRNQDLVDLACPPAIGHLVIDDSGDIAPEAPADGLRKRVYRRLTTKKGSFRFLPNYGVGFDHKAVGNMALVAALKTDALQQIKQEPDVAAVDIVVSMQASGVIIIQTRIRSRRGSFIDVGTKVSALGAVSPL